jgi:uncharacterized Zn-binding protein involved in type VI secretion
MGMPACTITSQTAHGGIVTVGFPQVLIGMMPASRIGDLHVCPMVTGIVPHVGGPFVLGSMTVLVGMMPQSRVTDELVCVGPPDVAVMGCETVLVGMAGAGGAGGAMAGISAMGASVPTQPPASSSSAAETAEMQQNGTIKYTAPADQGLPPYTHTSPGFPDLPAKEAPNFQTAQPVIIPAGTTIYRVYDPALNPAGSYWTPNVFPSEAAWRQSCAVLPKWPNKGVLVAAGVVQPPGLKAWMGAAARQEGLDGGGTQLFMPPGALNPSGVFQAPWAAAAQQAQAAEQALQAAQAAANRAQQAAAQGAAAAKQAVQAAQQQAQQAAEKAVQQAKQAAQQAVQEAQKAQQAAKEATQQAKQAAQQAAQQAQQAAQQDKAAAQQAAAQTQQQAQQTEQQAKNTAQQAQQSAQRAEQSAQQAEQALPKGLL